MTLSLKSRAFLVKLFYENGDCAAIALKKFRTLKGLRSGSGLMTAFGLKMMIDKLEESVSFDVKCGRGRKAIASTSVEDVAGIVKQCFRNVQNVKFYETSCNAIHSKLRIFRSWFLLTCQNEKLSPCNFLLEWKWTMHSYMSILSTDEAHFHLQGSDNTKFQNMGKRESVPNATIASSFSKGHCVVRVYCSIYR
ncbi:hypothetical protein AVEN_136560-1 [Araneus ventricosus]|uniref:DUF4817 domain-containing protein n=1 Tax=Araneus ventricosus TaxID=182803 RepID=A0A4Y2JRB6_ARAVE|nr:hypothetical protein AVEN_136560-1 [Araneus ventricosus]